MPIIPISNFRDRSDEAEEMDDLTMDGPVLERTLDDLAKVHRQLGGGAALIYGVKRAIDALGTTEQPIRLLDAGCGGGDGLRAIARWAWKRGIPMELHGMDANPNIIQYANRQASAPLTISYHTADLFDKEFDWQPYDVVTFSLILHHFSDRQITALLQTCREAGVRAVVINDLHRSALAHGLFRSYTHLVPFSDMARQDGLKSIRKGFRNGELVRLLKASGYHLHTHTWRWAFRFVTVGSQQVQ